MADATPPAGVSDSTGGRILVGTSGYLYHHWRRVLYPEALPQSRRLARYAEILNAVELNVTFYRLPAARRRPVRQGAKLSAHLDRVGRIRRPEGSPASLETKAMDRQPPELLIARAPHPAARQTAW